MSSPAHGRFWRRKILFGTETYAHAYLCVHAPLTMHLPGRDCIDTLSSQQANRVTKPCSRSVVAFVLPLQAANSASQIHIHRLSIQYQQQHSNRKAPKRRFQNLCLGKTCTPRVASHASLEYLFYTFFGRFSGWQGRGGFRGFTYNNRGLHSILLTNIMVVVPAHTPCWGRGGHGLPPARSPTPKRVPHRVPKRVRHSFRNISRFSLGLPTHGMPSPAVWSFCIFLRFGAQSHSLVVSCS